MKFRPAHADIFLSLITSSNMNFYVALLVCALVASSSARPEVNQDAAKESAQRIRGAHQKCQTDPATQVDETALRGLQSGGTPPANIGAHSLCISRALGWQNADGSVNRSVIETRAQAIFGSNNAELQRVVDECAVAQATPEETAIHIFKCYRSHAPHTGGSDPHDH